MAHGIFPQKLNNWSMEAWVALGAYPWLWGALIDLMDKDEGLTVGITDLGEFGFKYISGNKTIKIISEEQIPLYEWTHVAISFNQADKKITIYLSSTKYITRKIFFCSFNYFQILQ